MKIIRKYTKKHIPCFRTNLTQVMQHTTMQYHMQDIDLEEKELEQELEIIKRTIRFVDSTIKIITDKQDLYGSIEEYSIDMFVLKAYTSLAHMYNNINSEEITKHLFEISAYMIIILEKIEKMRNKPNGLPLHNKYESLINRIYINKHIQYNAKYQVEKTLKKQHISALMLMKAIRMKNLLDKIKTNEIAVESIKDNAIDILIFAYIMYNKITET